VTSSTATTLTGFLKGNGATVSAAAAVALGTDVTGILPTTSHPALTGDVTTPSASVATTVKGINGVPLSGLATGILKNTTGTGAPSIAVAADFPTLNQTTVGTLTGLTVNGATNINANNNAATNIGTGSTTSAVAIGGGFNTVTLGGGTAFTTMTYGAATVTIPTLAGNTVVTATVAVTGCATTSHLLVTESSYSLPTQPVVMKSATCSAPNTASIAFLNTNNGNLNPAGTMTFKYMLIKP
jgi:hypothetical protein